MGFFTICRSILVSGSDDKDCDHVSFVGSKVPTAPLRKAEMGQAAMVRADNVSTALQFDAMVCTIRSCNKVIIQWEVMAGMPSIRC